MTFRLAALALAGTLLLASCSDQPAAPPRSPTSKPAVVSSGCAELIVLGARGQTQDADKNLGVGTEVRLTAERLAVLQNASHGGSTRVVAIRYDAAATATQDGYVARVADGAQLLVDRLSTLSNRCPDSRFALIGFSEGAQVVHAAALELPAAAASRVGVVAMIADPRRNAQDAIAHWTYGGGEATRNGRLGAGTPLPADLRPVAISLCVAEDEICNAAGSSGQAPSEAHRTFYEKPSSAESSAVQLHRILEQ